MEIFLAAYFIIFFEMEFWEIMIIKLHHCLKLNHSERAILSFACLKIEQTTSNYNYFKTKAKLNLPFSLCVC